MTEAARQVEQVARLSYGRLAAVLAFRLGDISAAEDAFSDALLRALEVWPEQGLPENPEGWLLRTARNKAIDRARAASRAETYRAELQMLTDHPEPKGTDPRLKLMFVCAHPAIDQRLRAPLMLQSVLGLDARRIASVYLVSPGTLGQRLTRAKAKIETAGISFDLPTAPDEFDARLEDILAALYAAYAIGLTGLGTGDSKAGNLAGEALWLIGLICEALPKAAEAHGLFALILFSESRRAARVSPETGALIPLQHQDPSLWDAEMLGDAEQALRNAQRNLSLGRFQLEASIQAVHAARRLSGVTDWAELQVLYRSLVQISPTLGALTSQAVVEAELHGAEQGLALLNAIRADLRQSYQPWFATQAHLLMRAGQAEAAFAAFDTAIGLSNDPAERLYLQSQKSKLLSS
jgi:RNA polymerase sigma-70 factor (ECF subfamily)